MERAVSVNTRDRRDTCAEVKSRTPRESERRPKKRAARAPRARLARDPRAATPDSRETRDPSTSARMSMLSRVSSTRLRDDPPDPTPPQPLLPLPSLDPHSPAGCRPTAPPPRPTAHATAQRAARRPTVRSLSLRVSVTDVGGGEKLQTLNETPNTHNAHTHINTHIKHAHTHGTH